MQPTSSENAFYIGSAIFFWSVAIMWFVAVFAPTSRFGRLWFWRSKWSDYLTSPRREQAVVAGILLAMPFLCNGLVFLSMILRNTGVDDFIALGVGFCIGVGICSALGGGYLLHRLKQEEET
jgi:hypothetical protein